LVFVSPPTLEAVLAFFVGLASEAVMMLVDGNFLLGKLVWNGKSPLIRERLILAKYKGGR